MDPCAGLHILAHGSIPLPYLPNLCAVLRPAPLASYYFPFLSFPLLSPCIGLSLDQSTCGTAGGQAVQQACMSLVRELQEIPGGSRRGGGITIQSHKAQSAATMIRSCRVSRTALQPVRRGLSKIEVANWLQAEYV